ncbi:abortive infection family protein [Ligilactobacillus sp. LYQ135]
MVKLKTNNDKVKNLHTNAKSSYEKKDYLNVITKSRTMLEQFFIDTLKENGREEDAKKADGNINRQFKSLKELYKDKLSDELDENITNLIGSFTNIVNTIGYIRNNNSDAHASLHKILPSEMNESLASLTLDSAVIIINFLEELNAKVLDAKRYNPENLLLPFSKINLSKTLLDNNYEKISIPSDFSISNVNISKSTLDYLSLDYLSKEENTDNDINSDYYGLFIQSGKDFSKSGKAEMEWDRSFRTNEYTDERLLKMIYTDEGYISNDIINIPMIFGDEYIPSKNNQENNQLFYYGRLRNIEQNSKYVSIEYDILGNIPAEKMLHFSNTLDIYDLEFHRTHWALKHVNAIKTLGLDFSD